MNTTDMTNVQVLAYYAVAFRNGMTRTELMDYMQCPEDESAAAIDSLIAAGMMEEQDGVLQALTVTLDNDADTL